MFLEWSYEGGGGGSCVILILSSIKSVHVLLIQDMVQNDAGNNTISTGDESTLTGDDTLYKYSQLGIGEMCTRLHVIGHRSHQYTSTYVEPVNWDASCFIVLYCRLLCDLGVAMTLLY